MPARRFFSLGVILAAACQSSAQESTRPNVLIIVADDQSPYDLKIYNERSTLETPTLDRLARDGVVLDEAYHMGSWSGAVCTASRTMIMTGRTVWRLPGMGTKGLQALEDDPRRVPPGIAEQTLAAVFNRAGYDTFRTCKTGNSYSAANQRFQTRHEKGKRGGTDETGSAWHADRVLDYLDSRAESGADQPFLVYLGFSHPHDTRDGKPDLLAKYGATNHTDESTPPTPDPTPHAPKLPINYLPQHPFPHGHPGLRDEETVSGVWTRRDTATVLNEIGREFACAENIDTQIGRVVERLDAMGELENTIILYTSDHGIAIGRHGLMGKQNLYEHTWRVPLIVSGPGVESGARVPGGVYLLDILQTVCELAGIDAPETTEGLSFAPVVRGAAPRVRDTMYGVYSGGTKPGMRAVRRGDWKLIKYDVLDGSVRETQLFNLAENPWELLAEHGQIAVEQATGNRPANGQRNLASEPEHSAKRAELEAALVELQTRHGDPYRLWDQPKTGR